MVLLLLPRLFFTITRLINSQFTIHNLQFLFPTDLTDFYRFYRFFARGNTPAPDNSQFSSCTSVAFLPPDVRISIISFFRFRPSSK